MRGGVGWWREGRGARGRGGEGGGGGVLELNTGYTCHCRS